MPAGQLADRRVKHQHAGEKHNKVGNATVGVNDVQDQRTDADHRHRLHQRTDDLARANRFHRLPDELLRQLAETIHAHALQSECLDHAHAGKHLHSEAGLIDVGLHFSTSCPACLFTEVNDRHHADGEQHQHAHCQLPVDQAKAGKHADHRHRLRNKMPHSGRKARLQQQRVAVDARDQVSGGRLVEEANRQPAEVAKHRHTKVVDHALTRPCQTVCPEKLGGAAKADQQRKYQQPAYDLHPCQVVAHPRQPRIQHADETRLDGGSGLSEPVAGLGNVVRSTRR